MKGGVVAIVLALLSSPSLAQSLPRFDVDAHCKKIASVSGTHSATLEETCFDMEQDAYDKMKPNWPGVPSSVRAHCEKIAKVGGTGSYTLLDTCIGMELDAAKSKGGKTFKY